MDYKMEELFPIVSELTQKYTSYESTSITYERAQILMEAVLYCLNEYHNSNINGLVKKKLSIKEQYNIGMKLILEKVNNIREIFNAMSSQFEDFGIKCLHDTVQKGIPKFLKWYDIKFYPQNTILTLDYPILIDYHSLKGADAVYQYIQAIQMEQMFLSLFHKDYIILVLERYYFDYRNMIENICSIILTNTIGHIAIKKPLDTMEFLYEEYSQLSKLFGEKTISDIENMIKDFIKKIISEFYKDDFNIFEYLCQEIKNIAVRIYTANQSGNLNKVFIL